MTTTFQLIDELTNENLTDELNTIDCVISVNIETFEQIDRRLNIHRIQGPIHSTLEVIFNGREASQISNFLNIVNRRRIKACIKQTNSNINNMLNNIFLQSATLTEDDYGSKMETQWRFNPHSTLVLGNNNNNLPLMKEEKLDWKYLGF